MGEAMTSYFKVPKFKSEPFRRLVTSLPCQSCGAENTQAAHRNEGKGMALKTSDALVVALCPTCHTLLDQGSDMTKLEKREFWNDCYIKQAQHLIETGRIK